jgi:peptidoglycan hydrolase-like protein with peptidoglycan-binding domain
MRKKYFHTIQATIAALVVALAGCAGGPGPNPDTAADATKSTTPAIRTVTNFTPALKCMDDLLLAYGKKGYVMTTVGIPDSTGKASVGTTSMLNTAISTMSYKSKAILFMDYDITNPALALMFDQVGRVAPSQNLPKYYIRGSISQLDENAIAAQQGAGIAMSFLDLGSSKDQVSSVVSVDMLIGDTVSRAIMPGMSSTNSLVVTRTGSANELGGKIGKVGLSFNMSVNRSEGLGAGIRALIELGSIELIGKLLEVPYCKCLGIDKTNPLMRQQARNFYDTASPEDRIKLVQRTLKGAGSYSGTVDGRMSADLTSAISAYQAANGLIADGRINFDLYYALIDSDRIAPDPTAPQAAITAEPSTISPISLTLNSDNDGNYQLNEVLRANVQTTGDGFLYCYYQDVSGTIARIFPNRFNPSPVIKGNSPMLLPSEQAPFKIKFDHAGNERVTCYADSRDIVGIPDNVKGEDLKPLQIRSMDEIGKAFRTLNPRLAEATLNITVR